MSDKQAVLLIHGIGEQRPMDTLRGFVRAVWSTNQGIHRPHAPPTVYSKPDTVSGNYELRQLTVQHGAGIRTDFFEFYWAHMISGTRLSHVTAWARLLLLRWPWNVPARLRGVWLVLVVAIVGILALVVYNSSLPEGQKLIQAPAWLAGLGGLALSALVGFVVIQVIGDAARYLNPAPPNIEQRQKIRAKGIEVLKKLHERGYGRIILVGHSLGTVIGYDILTHTWDEFNSEHRSPENPREQALQQLETTIGGSDTTIDDYRKAQQSYLGELGENGNRWRVTDFVTLGSPLAHAEILLADDAEQLGEKQADREFPTCPPVTEKERIAYPVHYEIAVTGQGGAERTETRVLRVPHHAAVFGPTRWTNLYFPARMVIWGDLIGGPLAPIFGRGIRDFEVKTRRWFGFLSHTHYWWIPKSGKVSMAVEKLREALDLTGES